MSAGQVMDIDRNRKSFCLLILVVAMLVPVPSWSSDHVGNLDFFHPSPHLSDYLSLHTAEGTPEGTIVTGVLLDFEAPRADQVHSRLTSNFVASVGLPWSLEMGIVLPVILHNEGDDYSLGRLLQASGTGDLQLHLKYLFDSREDSLFKFGLSGFLSFPTGSSDGLFGHSTVTFRPDFVVQTRIALVKLALNAGLFLRGQDTFGSLEVGPELTYGLAAWMPIWNGAIVPALEIRGATDLTAPFMDDEATPLEIDVGVVFRFWQLRLYVGGGGGLTGYTAAGYRFMTGLTWIPNWRFMGGSRDRDKDGIPDSRDRCPVNPNIL